MQEKKHPLLSYLMPPAVRGATLRVAGFIAIYALRAAAMRRLRSETLAAARSAAR